MIAELHLLRPLWLLALLPAAALLVAIWRASDSAQPWRRWIAPHLLPHLVGGGTKRQRLRPLALLGPIWLLSILALAGPSFEREPAPFVDETTALVVAIDCGPHMLASDVQPTRLARAAQKLGDLLRRRPGASTGLVAYAGSAHTVMPPTRDAEVIRTLAGELSPEIMPRPDGDAAAAAVELALELLASSRLPGSVLLITDSLSSGSSAAIERLRVEAGVPVHLYALAAPPPDMDALRAARRRCGGELIVVTPDARDLDRLERAVASQVALVSDDGADAEEEQRWKDSGYWLLPLVLALASFWLRPGWAVRWPRPAPLVEERP